MPADLSELISALQHRLCDAVLAVERVEAETALVAKPTLVHRISINTEKAYELASRRLGDVATAHRTRRARRLDRLKIPWSGLEAIGRRGECPNRTDLDRVPREIRVERTSRDRRNLWAIPPSRKVDLGITSYLVSESRAASALDASLSIE